MNLHELNYNKSTIYYFNPEPLSLQEFKQNHTHLPGYIETFWDFNESNITINFLNSTKKYTGSLLLLTLFIQAYEHGIETVSLDDMSNNYRQANNIYIKMGLKYKEEWGPEMKGCVKDIIFSYNYL
jgi:hypothetical protein